MLVKKAQLGSPHPHAHLLNALPSLLLPKGQALSISVHPIQTQPGSQTHLISRDLGSLDWVLSAMLDKSSSW